MNEIFVVGAVDCDWPDGYFINFNKFEGKYYLTMLNKANIFYTHDGAETCRANAQLAFPKHNFEIFKYNLVSTYKPSKMDGSERRLDPTL